MSESDGPTVGVIMAGLREKLAKIEGTDWYAQALEFNGQVDDLGRELAALVKSAKALAELIIWTPPIGEGERVRMARKVLDVIGDIPESFYTEVEHE